MKISVSFLKSIYDTKTTIKKIEESSADYVHVDAMDGVFVENKSMEVEEFIELLKDSTKKVDIHLMMNEENSKIAIDNFSILKPEYITVHIELNNTKELIKNIKDYKIKAGIAINPDTQINTLKEYLPYIDLILVMGVYPGCGGQTFIENTISKLKEIKTLCEEENRKIQISIDGGINEVTAKKVFPYCDILVSGSFICMEENYQEQINKLK